MGGRESGAVSGRDGRSGLSGPGGQSGHLAMLGDDILKNRMTPGIDVSIFKDYFLQDIQKSSETPPDYHYIDKENREKRYRCTCKRLLTYLKKF